MSITDFYSQFRRPVQTLRELDLPEPDPLFVPGQAIDMRKGDRYHVFDKRSRCFADLVFVAWHDEFTGRRFAELRQIGKAESLLLYEDQILALESENRIVAVEGRRADVRNMPGGVHSLTTEEVAESLRRIEYVDALNKAKDDRKSDTLPDDVKTLIAEKIAKRRGERPPSKGWLCKMMRIERDGVALNRLVKFAPNKSKGNTKPRFASALYAIKEQAIIDALGAKMGAEDARNRVKELVKDGAEFAWARDMVLDANGEPIMKLSSFREGIADLDRYTKDRLRISEEFAARKHSRSVLSWKPKGILDVVDVDYSTLPVKVYDPLFPTLAYGRPEILSFRDRRSSVTYGYSISFCPPSFQTFIEGFRHAMFPKDHLLMSVSWPWFGKAKRLGVDLAAHLTGDQMEFAASVLGFEVTEYRARVPEDKAALEHLFADLDSSLLQSTPGHMPRPEKRKRLDFDDQDIKAEISIVDLRAMLDIFFAVRVNRRPKKGIGEIPTMKAIPDAIWESDIRTMPPRKLVDPQAFEWLAGDSKNVTIQDNGIQFDHLLYQSDELATVTANPSHQEGVRDGRRVHRATQYVATRPYWDVGHIWLMDRHRNNHPIRVPVDPSLASYANGLNSYQHELICEFKKEELEAHGRDLSFERAYEILRNRQIDANRKVRRDEVSRKIARHVEKQSMKHARARVLDLAHVDSGGRTSLAEPSTIEVREPISQRALRRLPAQRPGPVELPTVIMPRAETAEGRAAPSAVQVSDSPSHAASDVTSPGPPAQPAAPPRLRDRMSLAELRRKHSIDDQQKDS